MTYFFETYGCQMNSAESAALDLVCRERGWTAAGDGESADLVLLNTCSVRATAEQRVMGRLAHYAALKKKRTGRPLTLVVAGCMAERLGNSLKEKCPAVDYIMGTSARSIFPLILEAVEKGRSFEETIEQPVFSFSSSHMEAGAFRSFVPIMHGCNNFCSYCIVPYVRGREISRDPAAILEEIRLVGERGVREITLLGQNVNTYQYGSLDFPGLLRLIAAELERGPLKGTVRRVRFLSANPKDFSQEAIEVMAEYPVFCRHLHLCVQHGSDRILSAMNRGYTREAYLDLVRRIRKAIPGITFSTDILVGFPGETEEDLEETFALMDEVKFLYAYMYHYNPREGTAAFLLPNRVEDAVKKERLARVIKKQQAHTVELLKSRIGSRETVLIEGISRKNADELICRTEKDEMAV
ncbi:MAG: tRNA (N6-isopentenyl adenosine(37)-C2)-methylthiotransferase MiaB, partial [Treponema sp.]|nr:tRNA (N6-isopentenyl adenosine(37)-C2)-methylthiotransferase MiaB [Treponema sp.]